MNKVRLLFCSFILFSIVQISGCIMPHSTVLYATKDDEVAVQEMKDKYGEDFIATRVNNNKYGDGMPVPSTVHEVTVYPKSNPFLHIETSIKYDKKNGEVIEFTDNYKACLLAYSVYSKIRSFEESIERKLADKGITAYCELAIDRTSYLEGYDTGETLLDLVRVYEVAKAKYDSYEEDVNIKMGLVIVDNGEDVDIVLTKLEQVIQELVTNELNNEYFVDFNDIWFYTEKQFERFKQSHTDAMCRHYLGYYTVIDVLPDVYPNDKSESYQRSVALYTGTKDMIERLREDWLNKKQ